MVLEELTWRRKNEEFFIIYFVFLWCLIWTIVELG